MLYDGAVYYDTKSTYKIVRKIKELTLQKNIHDFDDLRFQDITLCYNCVIIRKLNSDWLSFNGQKQLSNT